ncbi:MAG TPA: 2Fe-2S iron-sulfur cluster-binding protein [Bryobacteraceae bacterium]|nr:2Fe-2S iron-sulfur cluster-binding protein [Bryobacteraceae bacterium]
MALFNKKPRETARITYISNAGEARPIDVPLDDSVMEGAIRNDVEGIVAECGGACMCATCHVYVDPVWLDKLPPIESDEDAMLDSTASDRLPNSRLSCQLRVTPELDGLIVRTPPTQQ